MSKNLVTVLFLTLITVLAWVGFQLFKISSQSTIPQPTDKQIRTLDPGLDKTVFDDLKEKIK